jgi:hypothetical protein
MDLKLTYYDICVVEKMVMWIKYGSYRLLIMPFGLRNAFSTFTTFMNSIFHDKLNELIIVYIDDILVYFKFVEKHAKHLESILEKKRKFDFLQIEQILNLFKKIWISFITTKCECSSLIPIH